MFKKRYRRFFDYTLAKRFYKKQGFKNVYQYGPTPLLTMEKMVIEFGIQKGQSLLDLGSGSSRHLFFLYHIFGIQCFGVDLVESFFRFAKALSKNKEITICCKNMLEVDLNGFDWVLFFATSFDDHFIERMIEKFLKGPKELKIITTSFSLNEYNDNFLTERSIAVRYPWGKTRAYVNKIK